MSTTVWLGMNSNTPSLAITRKDVVGVSWRTAISGSAKTPMDSAAAASHYECGCLATSQLISQQHHPGISKHDSNLGAAHAIRARCLLQGDMACEPLRLLCSVCLMWSNVISEIVQAVCHQVEHRFCTGTRPLANSHQSPHPVPPTAVTNAACEGRPGELPVGRPEAWWVTTILLLSPPALHFGVLETLDLLQGEHSSPQLLDALTLIAPAGVGAEFILGLGPPWVARRHLLHSDDRKQQAAAWDFSHERDGDPVLNLLVHLPP